MIAIDEKLKKIEELNSLLLSIFDIKTAALWHKGLIHILDKILSVRSMDVVAEKYFVQDNVKFCIKKLTYLISFYGTWPLNEYPICKTISKFLRELAYELNNEALQGAELIYDEKEYYWSDRFRQYIVVRKAK